MVPLLLLQNGNHLKIYLQAHEKCYPTATYKANMGHAIYAEFTYLPVSATEAPQSRA